MNPLNHFGIKNIMIRGDTSSYNNVKVNKCTLCGGYATLGEPNPNAVCLECKKKKRIGADTKSSNDAKFREFHKQNFKEYNLFRASMKRRGFTDSDIYSYEDWLKDR